MDKEKIRKVISEHNRKFLKQFAIGFFLVAIMTFFLGYFDWLKHLFTFKIPDKTFEIIGTIIGFLGVLLGFILTALGVIVSSVQNRFQSETNPLVQIKLNEYSIYLIGVAKPTMYLLLCYILAFINCLIMAETFKFYGLEIYLIIWTTLSTIFTCYVVFDRIFDYYKNPFEASGELNDKTQQ